MRATSRCLILAGALALPALSIACQPPGAAEQVRITQVNDGDTVRLEDGRRVRLVGIDTPEIGRDGRPSDAHAETARQRLVELLGTRRSAHLHPGVDARDRHGRTLAHLVLEDGRNAQRVLLEDGLAVVLAVPPNVRLLECYLAAESQARARGIGVWKDGAFGPLDAATLRPGTRGFRLVRGRVLRLGASRRSLWLEMGPRFSARVEREGLTPAALRFLQSLEGRVVTVRGYLFGDAKRTHLSVRHLALIER